MTTFLIQSIFFFLNRILSPRGDNTGFELQTDNKWTEKGEKDEFTERRERGRAKDSIMPTDRSFVVKDGSRIVQKNPND